MHLPLLDIPKPKRSARPHCASASVLFGVCALTFLIWSKPAAPPQVVTIAAPAKEASPVKYVTVTSRTYLLAHPCYQQKPCISIEVRTKQKPLSELYAELSAIDERAETERKTMPFVCGFSRDVRDFEERFAMKYGLTLKQVEEIKREGARLKREAGE